MWEITDFILLTFFTFNCISIALRTLKGSYLKNSVIGKAPTFFVSRICHWRDTAKNKYYFVIEVLLKAQLEKLHYASLHIKWVKINTKKSRWLFWNNNNKNTDLAPLNGVDLKVRRIRCEMCECFWISEWVNWPERKLLSSI